MAIKVTYRQTSRMSMRVVKNGDVHVSVPYGVSRDQVMTFIEENRDWMIRQHEANREQQRKRAEFYNQLHVRTDAEVDAAIERATALVAPMVEHYEKVMGVQVRLFYFQGTISRWGCCYPKDATISFSIYLLLLPEWCVEHVVVHEMCHLLEPSHNARFHSLMDRYFPRWREARAEIKRICGAN